MPKNKMKAAVFGSYDTSDAYQRNRVMCGCFQRCFSNTRFVVAKTTAVDTKWNMVASHKLKELWHSIRRFFDFYRQRHMLFDVELIFIPYPAYIDLVFLQLICPWREHVVIVDAFLALHETIVKDRQLVRPKGILSWFIERIESRTLRRANHILIDTEEQRVLLMNQYDIDAKKITAIPVGLDESQWAPISRQPPSPVIRALFWGTFIPLHGIETIIEAAQILDDRMQVEIRLIGDGQTADAVERKLAESELGCVYWRRELVNTEVLRREIAQCDVVLGIFGSSRKAGNVIPYKVHQALASNRPVITRESDALKYVDASFPQLVRVPAADPLALADAIQAIEGPVKKGSIPGTRGIYDRYFGSSVVQPRFNEAIAKAIKASP